MLKQHGFAQALGVGVLLMVSISASLVVNSTMRLRQSTQALLRRDTEQAQLTMCLETAKRQWESSTVTADTTFDCGVLQAVWQDNSHRWNINYVVQEQQNVQNTHDQQWPKIFREYLISHHQDPLQVKLYLEQVMQSQNLLQQVPKMYRHLLVALPLSYPLPAEATLNKRAISVARKTRQGQAGHAAQKWQRQRDELWTLQVIEPGSQEEKVSYLWWIKAGKIERVQRE